MRREYGIRVEESIEFTFRHRESLHEVRASTSPFLKKNCTGNM